MGTIKKKCPFHPTRNRIIFYDMNEFVLDSTDLDILRCLQENFADLKLGELLTWASRNGAEFLSVEDRYGRIAPGMKPGLVYIDNIGEGLRLTPQSRSYRVI